MERRSFLLPRRGDARAPCFQDVDLHAQPFLTKRGRASRQVVKRVFVVLDGYLFYFHSADATEPCGVIPLASSEYVAHSYSATDQTDNYCYELRSPARAWGTVILHYHNCPPAKAIEVEQLLEAAGCSRDARGGVDERREYEHERQGRGGEEQRTDEPADAASTRKARLARLVTLSGISSLAPWPRRKALGHELEGPSDGEAAGDESLLAAESKTFIARVKSGRHSSLLKIQWTTTMSDGAGGNGAGGRDSAAAVAGAAPRRRSTLSFRCRGGWASRSSFSDQRDILAESEIAVEHCHELCVSGFVENASRRLLHFISPHWAWEKLRRRRESRVSIVLDGADRQPRVRFASLFAPSASTGGAGVLGAVTTLADSLRRLSSPSSHGSAAFVVRRGDPRSCVAGWSVTRARSASLPLLLLTDGSPAGGPSMGAPCASAGPATLSTPPGPVMTPVSPAAVAPRPPVLSAMSSPSSRLAAATAPLRLLLQQQSQQPDKQLGPSVGTVPSAVSLQPLAVSPPGPPALTVALSRSATFSPLKSEPPAGECASPAKVGRTGAAKPVEARAAALASSPALAKVSPASAPAAAAGGRSATDLRIVQAISVAESYSGGYLLRRYEPLKVIGSGGFGQVMVARHKGTGQLVAIKTLSKRALALHHQVEHSLSEKAVLTLCRNHPFIVQLHAAFQTIDHLHLVLDYCPGGELFFHLSQRGRFQEPQAAFYLAEVLLALEHLHRHNVIYRDLKPENVLLDQDGHVRLADFGLSKLGVDDQTLAMTFCGSVEYLAPEVLAMGRSQDAAASPSAAAPRGYGRAADFWALGCLLFELLTGEPPFYSGGDRPRLYARILQGQPRFPAHMSAEAVDLISALLRPDPLERLGCRRPPPPSPSSPRPARRKAAAAAAAAGSVYGAAAVRAHPFFARHVDWERARARRLRPPVLPRADAFANFDKQFTSLPVRAVDKMVQFPSKIPMDYQLFENFNWEPSSGAPSPERR